MLKRIQLTNYKGFDRFSLKFNSELSVLVGPNNAGKSTIVGALRLCAQLISHAKLRKPTGRAYDDKRQRNVSTYSVADNVSEFVAENVVHEFSQDSEARVDLYFSNGSEIHVVWPVGDDVSPYFYLEKVAGIQPSSVREVRATIPTVSVVHAMTPVEHQEKVLSEEHVRKNLGSRLSSRHFRNQLLLWRNRDTEDFDRLSRYIVDNTPGVDSIDLSLSSDRGEVDLYISESGSRVEKELYWIGDGMQIWIQVLFHLYRNLESEVLILDEPDVFLHPDLQRRLVRVLDGRAGQVLLATHAPEVLAEVSRDAVIVVDRSRKSAKRMSGIDELTELNSSLGSGFNLRMARVLRSKVALFVEGQDMRMLGSLAKQSGALRLAAEDGVTVVPMGGASRRGMASSFGFLNRTILDSSVEIVVVLDGDYRRDSEAFDIESKFEDQDIFCHVWRRNEIESYLAVPSLIARKARISEDEAVSAIEGAALELKEQSFAQVLALRQQDGKAQGEHVSTTYLACRSEFDDNWETQAWRWGIVPGKELLSGVNRRIGDAGGKPVSVRALASSIRASEIDTELMELILKVESLLD
ncbi:ATP-dependent nuclease [Gordonia neofelifaecis]|uniref:ATP-dependent nuclease n=1 Tax=Gordonia neofelifaecis TaxID=945692 RepID=UPI0002D38637|nr:ATP-binding protein [Gordonia neofelifaecis]